jgi:Zn-dependent protease
VRNVDWERVAVLVSVIVPSVILHEVSHGFVAHLFGDDTAKKAGRLTLNPIAHVDPFGTVILPFILSLSGLGAFGYAKPVPVNVRNLRNPRQHSLYVSLAGPLTNISLAVVATVLLRTVFQGDLDRVFFVDQLPLVAQLVLWFGFINVVLAIFNLLPIPPLDGSALVERVLPNRWWPTWLKYRQYGFGLLLLLMFVGGFDRVLEPALDQWLKLV